MLALSTLNSNFDRRIFLKETTVVAVYRHDGKILYFNLANGTWKPDADIVDALVSSRDANGKITGWQLRNAGDDSVETYNADGRLVKITARGGYTQNLTLSTTATPRSVAPNADLLILVTDSFGRALQFAWNSSSNLSTLTDPGGKIYRFSYDSDERLTAVAYPGDEPQGPIRHYLYGEAELTSGASLSNVLTGIVDENGDRFASYGYDATGRAISTEHANGAGKIRLNYLASQTAITDSLNSERIYKFKTVLGALKISEASQPAGAGCNAASHLMTYDANGNVATQTDFNGNKTTRTYDAARNLELTRLEGAGTASARLTSTVWHGAFRLPVKIAEPKRLTSFTHDSKGNVLSKTEQATADASGTQAFAASGIGVGRVWRYSYNDIGQVLSMTGPRTDLVERHTYAYDPVSGNLLTSTNPVGHVTKFADHDAHGRVGTIIAPNGVVTHRSYTPRGWLSSQSETTGGSTLTTVYTYDNVGQVTMVTLPDHGVLNYAYDPAHRLTDVTDSSGNSVHYVLDGMGNRIKETIKDPSGTLTRQIIRAYDPLNRIQALTGAAQ